MMLYASPHKDNLSVLSPTNSRQRPFSHEGFLSGYPLLVLKRLFVRSRKSMVVRSILIVPGLRRSMRRVAVAVAALSLFGIAACAGGPPSQFPTLRVSPDAPH